MSEGPVPVRIYLTIFACLLALTALTTGVAFIDMGPLNTVAALTIAVGKMLLVILFFMHLRHSPRLTKVAVVAGFFWLVLLIGLTLSDTRTRHWTPGPSPWVPSATQSPP
ncbi:MAG: cytochrome C oxidase subunit IV family protein [Terriglobia bacterium]